MVGADKLVIPGPNATDEQRSEFYTKLGRPATSDLYEMDLPEGLDAEKMDKTQIDLWKERLHKAGVPASQAKELLSTFVSEDFQRSQAQQQGIESQLTQWEMDSKEKFGDKFEETANFARYALKEAGVPGALELLESTGLANHPAILATLAKLGAAITESTAKGGGTVGFNANTPEGAQAQLLQFNRNPETREALYNKSHPNHDAAVAERLRLNNTAYPEEGSGNK